MFPIANISGMFGMDGLIIFLVILLLFGAKRLPELAKGLGSAMREFSKAKDDIQHEITRDPTPAPRIEAPRETQAYVASTEEDYHRQPSVPASTPVEATSVAVEGNSPDSPRPAQPPTA